MIRTTEGKGSNKKCGLKITWKQKRTGVPLHEKRCSCGDRVSAGIVKLNVLQKKDQERPQEYVKQVKLSYKK